ncbi:unnamed protein product [Protopolystoma xenopodis]|uniref:Uncharacterized protein n=1 Tax=Protopolystoma xenopodis TaxID=117903 RepID=A0A448X6N8_9PLAT|nr:unnamed protein product [Protopolystoma xenopodis]
MLWRDASNLTDVPGLWTGGANFWKSFLRRVRQSAIHGDADAAGLQAELANHSLTCLRNTNTCNDHLLCFYFLFLPSFCISGAQTHTHTYTHFYAANPELTVLQPRYILSE